MLKDFLPLQLDSCDGSSKRISFEQIISPGEDNASQSDPAQMRFLKRVRISDGEKAMDVFLDFEAVQRLSNHLIDIVEIARGEGLAPEND